MIIRELLTRWGFVVDEKPLQKAERALRQARTAISTIAVGTVAATGAIFGFAASTANAGDAIAKTSRKLNIGSREYQRLRFAADQSGVSNEIFDQGLKRFIGTLGEAASGTGNAADIFAALGVQVKGADGQIRGTEAILGDFADRFSAIPNQAQKSALAMKLFGREGATMSLLLNEGREGINALGDRAEALGNVLSEDTLAAAEDLNDRINEAKQIFLGLKNTIGAELMPVVTRAIVVFREWFIANRELIRLRIRQFLKDVVALVRLLIGVWNRWIKIFSSGVDKLTAYRRAIIALIALSWALVAPWSALAAAIFLLADDVAAYFQGNVKNSATGRLIGGIKNLIDNVGFMIRLWWSELLDDLTASIDEWWQGTAIYQFFNSFTQEPQWFKGLKTSFRERFPVFSDRMAELGDSSLIGGYAGGRTGYGRGGGFANALANAKTPANVTQNNTFNVPNENIARIVAKKSAEQISSIFRETAREMSRNPNFVPVAP